MILFLAALSTFIVNLPFGYWRSRVPKMSWQWFLAIHLPVPVVILFRFLFGLGFELITYPVMVLAFFLGQWLGGMIKKNGLKSKSPRSKRKDRHQVNK